ncbi:hypothetical protein ACI2S3_05125 [Ralstonia nicotianae]
MRIGLRQSAQPTKAPRRISSDSAPPGTDHRNDTTTIRMRPQWLRRFGNARRKMNTEVAHAGVRWML